MKPARTTTPHMPAVVHLVEDGNYHAGGGAALYATPEVGFLGLGDAKRIRFSVDLPAYRGRHVRVEMLVTVEGLARLLVELHDGELLDHMARLLTAKASRAIDDQVAAIDRAIEARVDARRAPVDGDDTISAEIVAATAGRVSP